MILVDWSHFTPIASFVGGALIGLAAVILLLWNGRIAGISGILGGLLRFDKGDIAWRVLFIAGLLLAPWLFAWFAPLPEPQIDSANPLLIVAGLLVGFGTRLGSGCTSGHGVCGLARFSLRSLVATAGFMAIGFLTVYVTRDLFH
jgi:hypothetical protein